MHFLLCCPLLDVVRLQLKVSSQNSANQTFLRLFSRVRDVKYQSKAANTTTGQVTDWLGDWLVMRLVCNSPLTAALFGSTVMALSAVSSRCRIGTLLVPQLSEPTHRK